MADGDAEARREYPGAANESRAPAKSGSDVARGGGSAARPGGEKVLPVLQKRQSRAVLKRRNRGRERRADSCDPTPSKTGNYYVFNSGRMQCTAGCDDGCTGGPSCSEGCDWSCDGDCNGTRAPTPARARPPPAVPAAGDDRPKGSVGTPSQSSAAADAIALCASTVVVVEGLPCSRVNGSRASCSCAAASANVTEKEVVHILSAPTFACIAQPHGGDSERAQEAAMEAATRGQAIPVTTTATVAATPR